MCPSSQFLYFSPLSQVSGRALAPSLHPNRAPATAPLVSASPPWKQHQTTERTSVTPRYHGSKISGSQQSFLTETAICIVKQWKKSMGYILFLSAITYRKLIHANSLFVCLFSSIFAGQQFIEIIRSCDTMLTWRNDFSSLEAICSYSLTWAEEAPRNDKQRKLPFQMLWALCFSFQVPLLLSSMVRLYHLNHVNDYSTCYGHCRIYTSVNCVQYGGFTHKTTRVKFYTHNYTKCKILLSVSENLRVFSRVFFLHACFASVFLA